MAKRPAQPQPTLWTSSQTYILAAITLILGIGVGWLLHSSFTDSAVAARPAASTAVQTAPMNQATGRVSPDDVNKAAAPMLAQLQQRPNDATLLASIGNLYYDSQAYAQAIEYYRKSLALVPSNPDVRTDMGTAIWYSGDAEGALKEFATSLTYSPTHNGTLFNRGVVLWQGKHDAKAAIASWQQLLRVNPNYPERQKVETMIAQASQGS